jgi:hypothetical protein
VPLAAEYLVAELTEMAHSKHHRTLRCVHLAEAAVADPGLALLLLRRVSECTAPESESEGDAEKSEVHAADGDAKLADTAEAHEEECAVADAAGSPSAEQAETGAPLIAVRYWNATPDQCPWRLWGVEEEKAPAFTLWNVGVLPSGGESDEGRSLRHLTTDLASRRALWSRCAEITECLPSEMVEASDADFPWEAVFLPRSLITEAAPEAAQGEACPENTATCLLCALGEGVTKPCAVEKLDAQADCFWDPHYYDND